MSSLVVKGRNLQVASGSKIGPKCFKSVAKLVNEISHEYHEQKQNLTDQKNIVCF